MSIVKLIDENEVPFCKLISIISKGQAVYLKHHLEDYGINPTQLYLLFELSEQCNTNQEAISKRFNINKGSVARSFQKLEDKGMVVRQIDENNRRQNKLILTEKGKKTLNETEKILQDWEDNVLDDEDQVDRELLKKALEKIAIKSIELNQGECNG